MGTRHAIRGAAAGCGLLAAALACATPVTEEAVEQRLRTAGAAVRPPGPGVVLVPVYADSKVAAWTLIAEARGEGASPLAERLSHDLRLAAKRRGAVVVGGPYPELTRLVLLEALELLEDRPLAGLTLVYVGDMRHAAELRQAASALAVRFYQRPW